MLKADAELKRRQAWWEVWRDIAFLMGAAAAAAGVLGFKLGQGNPPTNQIVLQPGAIVVQQPAPPAGDRH